MSDAPPDRLKALREGIDRIDAEILSRLSERGHLAREVGEVKKALGEDGADIYKPDRERSIFRRLHELNQGPFDDPTVEMLFREIISACRALEKKLSVGYLGPEGTFSHEAAVKHFGSAVNAVPCPTISEVFREVEKERLDVGIVPMENSTDGSINTTLDELARTSLTIGAERYLPIRLYLYSPSGDIARIKRIFSHPQPFGQCREWIQGHLPSAEIVECSSTAAAARKAADDPDGAAIGGPMLGALYGLREVVGEIEDYTGNLTRFLVIGRFRNKPTGADRTSILFTLSDAPGALFNALKAFSEAGINLTKIESRPRKGRQFEYHFFVGLDGHADDARIKGALEAMRPNCTELKILGSYPKAEG